MSNYHSVDATHSLVNNVQVQVLEEENSEKKFNGDFILKAGSKQIFNLFMPVSSCMILTILIAQNVSFYQSTDVYLPYTPFHTDDADVGTATWQTIANVAIMMTCVVVMTLVLFLLFKYECYKCLHGWMILTTIFILFFFAFVFFSHLVQSMNIFFDTLSFIFILWNFGIAGMIAIHWKAPLVVQQSYLIFVSFQMAIIFLKYVPKWTCWVLLFALAIWDLLAVLCPKGPLKMLIELSVERDRPLLTALIYSTTATFAILTVTDRDNENSRQNDVPTVAFSGHFNSQSVNQEVQTHAIPKTEQINWRDVQTDLERRNDHGVMLGLGDFIFYSLLIGRASLDSDGVTIVACFVAVLIGMCTTIIILGIMRKALPALPVSITCGILFYFVTSKVMSPFVDEIFNNAIFF